jgi:hypothetical protein
MFKKTNDGEFDALESLQTIKMENLDIFTKNKRICSKLDVSWTFRNLNSNFFNVI